MPEDDEARAVALAKSMDWNDPHFRQVSEYDVYSLLQQYPQRYKSEKTNEWYFVGYDECREAFRTPELFSNDFSNGQVVIPEMTDAPDQREYRRILDPMFSPR